MIEGTATITGTPAGWQNSGFYVQACPASEAFSVGCARGAIGSPPASPGHYGVKLKPSGTWHVAAYYYDEYGQIINGVPLPVTVANGETRIKNVTVSYVVPAAEGRVILTGAPNDFGSKAYMGVQACPARRSFRIGCRGGTEAYENIYPGKHYSIDLPPGPWMIGAYYQSSDSSRIVSGHLVEVTSQAGHTLTVDLRIAYRGL